MKNLFLVVNKEKIYAYVVSIMTVVVIFFMSGIINSDLKDTEQVSSNNVENVEMNNTIETGAEVNNTDLNNSVMSNAEAEVNSIEKTEETENGEIGEAISTSTGNMENDDGINDSSENNLVE